VTARSRRRSGTSPTAALAAMAAGLACSLVLRRLPLPTRSTIFRPALRAGGPLVVFLAAVVILAG
jgi:hypothetical protein